MNKAVFLDRDNTIIEDKGYVYKIEDLKFLPGTIEGLKRLSKEFIFVIITNQSGIGRGYYTKEQYESFKKEMNSKLKEHGIVIAKEYYCPHHPEKALEEYRIDCNCRKPKTGMLDKAKKELNIDFKKSWVIGDKSSDIGAGKNIKARTIGILNQYSDRQDLEQALPDKICNNLEEA